MPLLGLLFSPIGRKVISVVLIVVAIAGGFLFLKVHYYNQGWAAAIAAIAAQDQRAIDAKDEAVSKVRACRDRGGTWNVSDGVCE